MAAWVLNPYDWCLLAVLLAFMICIVVNISRKCCGKTSIRDAAWSRDANLEQCFIQEIETRPVARNVDLIRDLPNNPTYDDIRNVVAGACKIRACDIWVEGVVLAMFPAGTLEPVVKTRAELLAALTPPLPNGHVLSPEFANTLPPYINVEKKWLRHSLRTYCHRPPQPALIDTICQPFNGEPDVTYDKPNVINVLRSQTRTMVEVSNPLFSTISGYLGVSKASDSFAILSSLMIGILMGLNFGQSREIAGTTYITFLSLGLVLVFLFPQTEDYQEGVHKRYVICCPVGPKTGNRIHILGFMLYWIGMFGECVMHGYYIWELHHYSIHNQISFAFFLISFVVLTVVFFKIGKGKTRTQQRAFFCTEAFAVCLSLFVHLGHDLDAYLNR